MIHDSNKKSSGLIREFLFGSSMVALLVFTVWVWFLLAWAFTQ